MNDTTAQAEEVRCGILRAMSPAKRLAMAVGWSSSLREMTRAHLKDQFSDASPENLKLHFANRWLGKELAAKVYGPDKQHG